MASFAASAGWNENGPPNEIQRRAPPATRPTPGTRTSTREATASRSNSGVRRRNAA